jgi:hypothetical protein
MARTQWRLGVARAGALVLLVVCAAACEPRLRSHSSEVLNRLGKAAGFGGTDCPSAEAMVDVYLEEIGRRPAKSLSVTVPQFARRAASICPQSHPTIRLSNGMDVTAVGALLGGGGANPDGSISLERWLRANVDRGKVVSLTVDLEKVTR